ncbi:MAG: DUF3944 domain-containing protein [Helicobacter sp.]|nr:DUF3944 domain-containing protein [Helicobacter sp.]
MVYFDDRDLEFLGKCGDELLKILVGILTKNKGFTDILTIYMDTKRIIQTM